MPESMMKATPPTTPNLATSRHSSEMSPVIFSLMRSNIFLQPFTAARPESSRHWLPGVPGGDLPRTVVLTVVFGGQRRDGIPLF
ncbi:hypothetical protein GCM10010038_09610 [Glutamicibacter protophormiae]|nr:hypothetical protein GCM10010038_09610 [Glutamicibacter protophormiae]